MRHWLPKGCLLALGAAFASSVLFAGVDIRLSGGVFGASLPDLNSYLRDAGRFKFDSLRTANYTLHSGFEEIGGGSDFALSLAFPIAGHLGLAVETGIQRASRRGMTMSLESSFSFLDDTRDMALTSVPVFVGLDYGLPVGRIVSVHAFASAGLVFASFKESGEEILRLKSGASGYTETWTAKASSVGYGAQAGLALEIKLGGPLALSLRGGARRAAVTDFRGKSTTTFGSSSFQDDDLRLYYYEFFANYPGDWYGAISLPNAEQGSRLRAFRDASLGFSGLFLGAGLRLSLEP